MDDLLRDVLAKYGLAVPRLRMDQVAVESRKTTIDARRDPNKVASVFARGPVPMPGWAVTVRVPFEGSAELFNSSPPRFTNNPPRAFVTGKTLELRYEMDVIEAAALKARYEGDLQPIREWLSWQEEAIGGFNDSLAQAVRAMAAAERRREELADAELAKLGLAVNAFVGSDEGDEEDAVGEEDALVTVSSVRQSPYAHLTSGEDPKYESDGAPWTTAAPPMKDADESEVASFRRDGVDVLIVTAVDVERDAVLREMKPASDARRIRRAHVGKQTFYLGRMGSYTVALTTCRMGSAGRDASTLTVADAIDVCRPRCVIAVGIAFGGNTAKLKIGDVLVSSQVIAYEAQRKEDGRTVYRGPRPEAGAVLLNRFSESTTWNCIRPDGQVLTRFVGPLLSGEKLVDSLTFKAELFSSFPDAIGGEMEASGIYAGASRRDLHEWIVVKAVCDWADGSKSKAHQPLATWAAVSLVAHVLGSPSAFASLRVPTRSAAATAQDPDGR